MKDVILYRITRPLVKVFMKIFFRPTYIGTELIPTDVNFILVGNHTSYLDPLLLMSSTNKTIHFLAKDSLAKGIKGLLFRSMGIPVRTLECCSGDLADLKAKSCDVEAWSPRQKKYFEVGSCSNLTDAQARRLGIRIKGEKENYYAHTLNNTVVAPPRMLIAVMENNYQPDGSVVIPEVLRPYMGGLEKISPKK